MKQHWQSLATRVLAMSLRERLLIALTGIGLLLMPGYSLLLEPTWLGWHAEQQSSQELSLAIAQSQLENQSRQQALLLDPTQPLWDKKEQRRA